MKRLNSNSIQLIGWALMVANALSFVFINGVTNFVLFDNLTTGSMDVIVTSWLYSALSTFITFLAGYLIYKGWEAAQEPVQDQGPDITVNVIGRQQDI
jgi:hypothetical protein